MGVSGQLGGSPLGRFQLGAPAPVAAITGTATVTAPIAQPHGAGFVNTLPAPLPLPPYSGGGVPIPSGRPGVHITPAYSIKPKAKPAPKPLPIRCNVLVVAPPGRAEAKGAVSTVRANADLAAPAPLARSHGRVVQPIKGRATAARRAPVGPRSHASRYPKTHGAAYVRTHVSGLSGRALVVPPTSGTAGVQPIGGHPFMRGRVLDPPRWESESLWLLGVLDLEEAEDGLVPA